MNEQAVVQRSSAAMNTFIDKLKKNEYTDTLVGLWFPDRDGELKLMGITKKKFVELWTPEQWKQIGFNGSANFRDVHYHGIINNPIPFCGHYIWGEDPSNAEKINARLDKMAWDNNYRPVPKDESEPDVVTRLTAMFSDSTNPKENLRRPYPLYGCINEATVDFPASLMMVTGIVKGGVHLVVWAEDPVTKEPKFFVSARSKTTTASAGKYDQITAGGTEKPPGKMCDPLWVLAMKARQEIQSVTLGDAVLKELREKWNDTLKAGTDQDLATNWDEAENRGTLDNLYWPLHIFYKGVYEGMISYHLDKDKDVGTWQGAIEPGIRYVYSIQVPPDFKAEHGKAYPMTSMSVQEVLETVDNRGWKANSGHIMLYFLLKNRYILKDLGDEDRAKAVEHHFTTKFPFPQPDPDSPVVSGERLKMKYLAKFGDIMNHSLQY
jgi:hypothetical protein